MNTKWRIQDRWPAWSRWRTLTPAPHSERNKFDGKGIYWESEAEAQTALRLMAASNVGDFRIVPDGFPCGCSWEARDLCGHGNAPLA